MTKQRAALLALIVAVAGLVSWLSLEDPTEEGLSSTPPLAVAPRSRPGERPTSPREADESPDLSSRRAIATLSAADAADAGVIGVDANEVAGMMRALTDGSVRAKLERNAKRAAEELERFCELGAKLEKQPLFPEGPGTRDAAIFMSSRIDWEGTPARLGSLHVPQPLTDRTRQSPEWLVNVTDTDLAGLDFTWMKQLLAFDVWTITGDGAGEDLSLSAIASHIPHLVSLQTQVKLRFSRALRDRDWSDAVIEVRHLAHLVHTMSFAIGEAIAVSLLRLEIRAREQATRLGVDLSALPPLPDASLLDAHRVTGIKGGWFVAPGVPDAVRKRALECSPLKCTTVLEGVSLHSSLRAWSPPGSLESFLDETRALGCEPAMVDRLTRMPPATLEDLRWLLSEEDDGPLLPSTDAGR